MAEPPNPNADFQRAFARSVRTPLRPLRPSRRVWAVGLGMPVLAAACLAAVTAASSIEFGGDGDGRRKPVAQAAPMQDKPVEPGPGGSAAPQSGPSAGSSTGDSATGAGPTGAGTPDGGSAYPAGYPNGGTANNGASGGSGGAGGSGGSGGSAAGGSTGTFGGGGSTPGAQNPGPGSPGGGGGGSTAPAAGGGNPGGSGSRPPVQPDSLAPRQTFLGTSGYGCANSGASGFAELGRYSDGSKGWYTVGSGGWNRDGCNGRFDAVPMSGDKNKDDTSARVLWWFDVGNASKRCRLSVYVPSGNGRDVGGNPAQYFVLRTKDDDKSGAWYGQFVVNQVGNKGRWVDAGTFPVTNGRIAVKLVTRGVDWGGTSGAHLAAGQVQASCTG